MKSKNRLEIKNFSFSYGKDSGKNLLVLDNLSLELAQGEFVSIVGPSGCGKTTILNSIAGLLPHYDGKILLRGVFSMVFQDDSLLPWRTALSNIIYGLEIRGKEKKELSKAGHKLVSLVGLEGFENFYPHQLSGGMQQRVNLARALATDPEILLMDEPFASLDAQTRELMQKLLLDIWQKNKKTVLFVTHQINEAIYLSDRIIVLSARPGSIREVIKVNLPRPRSLEIKLSDKFIKLERKIWEMIMYERSLQ